MPHGCPPYQTLQAYNAHTVVIVGLHPQPRLTGRQIFFDYLGVYLISPKSSELSIPTRMHSPVTIAGCLVEHVFLV